jgi:hypothetical protein
MPDAQDSHKVDGASEEVVKSDGPRLTTYFDLVGDGFDPNEVTAELGIEPTKTWRRGESLVPGMRPRSHDVWSLKFGGEASWDFESQLDQLVELMQPRSKALAGLYDRFGIRAHVTCEVLMEADAPAICLDAKMVSALADLQADLEIDVLQRNAELEEEWWVRDSGR